MLIDNFEAEKQLRRMRKPKKVLVVDDDPFMTRLLTNYLEFYNCEIHEASNAHDALNMICAIKPDLIVLDIILPMKDSDSVAETDFSLNQSFSKQPVYSVMDIDLPGGNGIEIARVIKQHFPETTIMAISGVECCEKTGIGAADYLKMVRYCGAEMIMQKPISREDFFKLTDDFFYGKQEYQFPSAVS